MDNATGGEEEELSLKSVMALLKAINTRMSRFERSENNSASVHTVYIPIEPTTSRASTEADPARSQDTATPDGYHDVSGKVRAWVTSHIQSTPTLFVSMDDETASGEEGLLPARRKRGLKSGNARTMDSIVTWTVVWLHEVVITTQGQLPLYCEMSLALFVS